MSISQHACVQKQVLRSNIQGTSKGRKQRKEVAQKITPQREISRFTTEDNKLYED